LVFARHDVRAQREQVRTISKCPLLQRFLGLRRHVGHRPREILAKRGQLLGMHQGLKRTRGDLQAELGPFDRNPRGLLLRLDPKEIDPRCRARLHQRFGFLPL